MIIGRENEQGSEKLGKTTIEEVHFIGISMNI